MSGTVLVAGGTGVMGSRVVRLLARMVPDARVLVGVHETPAPPGRTSIAWDHDRPGLQQTALRGVAVLVDAAGPYDRDPLPTIRACQAQGVHYVDLAECPRWLHRVRGAAGACAIALVPGASTMPGLVEVLVRHHQDRGVLDHVRADLLMASGQPPGPGMLRSLLGPLGRRDDRGSVPLWRLRRRYGHLYGAFPCPPLFAGGEHPIPCRFEVGFDAKAITIGLHGLSVCAAGLGLRGDALARWLTPVARMAAGLGGHSGRLDVRALDDAGTLVDHLTVRASGDPLEVPALPAVLAAAALLAAAPPPHGCVSLAQLVTRNHMIEALQRLGCTVDSAPPRADACAENAARLK